jgi:hypothetical protein
MTFLPRLRRRSQRDPVSPISTSSFSIPIFHEPRSSARLSRPPDLPNEVLRSPPPKYSQLPILPQQHVVGGAGWQRHFSRDMSPVSPIQEIATPRLTSGNLSRLEEFTRSDGARNIVLKNRISTVSQYPVFIHPPPPQPSSRRRASRRPLSVASTSTTGVYLALGQLPGSEPLHAEDPSLSLLEREEQRAMQATSPIRNMDEPVVVQTAQAVRVQMVRGSPSGSTTSVNQVNRISIISTSSTLDLARQRTRSRSGSMGSQGPRMPSMRPARTWPLLRHDALESAASASYEAGSEIPPRPPPKDPGYVGRPGPSRLRNCSSTPDLLSSRAFDDRPPPPAVQPEEERKAQQGQRSGAGKQQQERGWLGGIGGNKKHERKSLAHNYILSDDQDAASRGGHIPSHHHRRSTSNRRSQMLMACARLIGRAMPRVAEHSKEP